MNKDIRDLIDKLNYYTKKYDEGHPEISDKEWDKLYFKLQDLESLYHVYYKDSPTQSVNYQVVNKLKKVTHNHPMLSLNKTKSIDEIKSFLGNKDFICMAKVDGLTCSLRYLNGKLVSAETRGNGIEGEDILHNALVIKNIPKKIDFQDELIVDGEIVCKFMDFKPFENEYKNPRNFASGSIRLLDSQECSKRNLSFIAWDVIKGVNKETLVNRLLKISSLGFEIVNCECNLPEYKNLESLMEVVKNCGYPIDGLVFKYNNVKEYEEMGRTDHHFKGGIAYKFYDEEYETILLNIEWTMGRTGQLTPVAIFNPIDIDGTEVSRASLHNISVMDELSGGFQKIGDKLMIYKANQIIPQVSSWGHQKDYSEEAYLHIPEKCPYCNKETVIKQDNESKVLYCNNSQCEGKLVNKIEHFLGKEGLNAKGISKATIEKLIDWGWIKEITDLFILSKYENEWKNVPGFGEKSVSNILRAIETCRNCDLESVIASAGIPLIGRTVSRDLARRFKTYSAFKEAIMGDFDFSTINGFGYEMNKSLKTFNYAELDNIVEKYLTIEKNNDIINTEKLKDITFCITGKVNIWKNRDDLSQTIISLGGKIVGSVSKNVNYLINNDVNSSSSKNLKAKELNIKIISEADFKKMFDIEK